MSLQIVTEATQRCQECGEPLPKLAEKIFKANDKCCPRCVFLHREVGIELGQVEIRDMSLMGRSRITVPRVEFHSPGRQPRNAIPA